MISVHRGVWVGITILGLGIEVALLTSTVVSSHGPLEVEAPSRFSMSELGYEYAGSESVRWPAGFSPSLDWMLSIA